ncbi:hypothetical protein BZZ01_01185 [Nostocales cyanobacterium HT-58-2]|nr:hypothetical protein BZZ01_01185 [Nostocales cyanobacterium HT-58-2]
MLLRSTVVQPKVGDKVLILRPAYVAGKIGEVCGREILLEGQSGVRWLIQVDCENIMVSLTPREFERLTQENESL